MNPFEGMAGQLEWVAANMAYNLDFIPDDKLNWKPAPSANSAIEIVNHNIGAITHLGAMVDGSTDKPEFATATDGASAKKLLVEAANAYAAKLRSLNPADAGKMIKTPFGPEWPLIRIASMAVVDTIHHHGQIAYIQTLLGDTESHFDTSLF